MGAMRRSGERVIMTRRTVVATMMIAFALATDSSGARHGSVTSSALQQGGISVVDVRNDPTTNDYLFLVSDTETGMQSEIPRMDLCKMDEGKTLVLDAYKWLRGGDLSKPNNKYTCCVRTDGKNKCKVIGEDNKVSLKEPHLEGEGMDHIFVGVHGTWYGCPEGFAPLKFKGPFKGAADTCCSFFNEDSGTSDDAADGTACGSESCATKVMLRETGFCDPMPTEAGRSSVSKYIDDSLSGPVDNEADESEDSSCVISQASFDSAIEEETAKDEEGGKRTEQEIFADLCKVKTETLSDNIEGKYCAYCQRSPKKKGEPIERVCTDCSRTRRAARNGWMCQSFAPKDVSCGAESIGATSVRKFERYLDFDGLYRHPNTLPVGGMETLTDSNDGRNRQMGPAARTSPLRPSLRIAKKQKYLRFGDPKLMMYEAVGTCPELRSLHLESSRDEPLQATQEDFAKDNDRLQEIMMGLGTVSGLGDVRSVLYPRMSASAPFDKPDAVGFLDASSHHFSCSDSRSTDPIVGTPGGDLAEFILAMNVLEKARSPGSGTLSDEHVMYYFQEFLEQMNEMMGKTLFFMCADEPSLTKWAEAAQVADPTRPRGVGEIARLAEYGVMHDHIGSAHLREMVRNPAEYRCRPGLVKSVVRAFLTVYYDVTHPSQGRLVIGTYGGDYPRGTLLYVSRHEGYRCGNMSPMVTPVSPYAVKDEIFVVHRAAVDVYREHLARYVTKKLGMNPSSEAYIFRGMRDIGEIQLKETTRRLLPGVEPYTASFMTTATA